MRTPRDRRIRTLIGTGILLAIQLGVVMLARRLPPEVAVIWGAALATFGTLTIAYVVAPLTPYTKAAHWTSSAVLAGSIVVAAGALPADVWLDAARQNMWMIAWFPLMMGTMPAPRHGACSPRTARVGWLMVGVSAFVGIAVMLTDVILGWRRID
jgi:hypothetical protein